jgi:hypothetical protein
MPTESDEQLVSRLLQSTEAQQLDWEPTAAANEFVTSFGGKYTVTMNDGYTLVEDRPTIVSFASLKNAQGETLLSINSSQLRAVADLHEAARRRAMKVDQAVADVLLELDKPKRQPR